MTPAKMYVGIKAVIVKNEKMLVLRRLDGVDGAFWDLPGGRMNNGESIEQTLARELREELPSLEKHDVKSLIWARKKEKPLHDGTELCFLYYAVDTPAFEVQLSDEHNEYRWMNRGEITQLPSPLNEVYLYLLDQMV